jgi:hypothetical protein
LAAAILSESLFIADVTRCELGVEKSQSSVFVMPSGARDPYERDDLVQRSRPASPMWMF